MATQAAGWSATGAGELDARVAAVQQARWGVNLEDQVIFGSAFIRAGAATIEADTDAVLPAALSLDASADVFSQSDGAGPDQPFPGALASSDDAVGVLSFTADLQGEDLTGSFVFPFDIDSGGGGSGGGLPADASGFDLPLGPVATKGDGSWSGGAVALTDAVKVSDAVDQLNTVLGKLVPAAPTAFPGGSLTISNSAGSSPHLASGVTDNSGSSPWTAGDSVTRITAVGASSNTFNDVGPGDTGTLSASVNGVVVGSHGLTGSGDDGAYSGLVIADQKAYPPATPGFWTSIDVSLSGLACSVGVNKVKIAHTAAGATSDVYLVRDGMTSAPAVSGTVTEATLGTVAYSSSVPHYGTGGQLSVDASITNLAGETYYGGADPLVLSGTGSIFSSVTLTYVNLGISTPIARQTTTGHSITTQTVDINGSVHGSGVVQATAKNVNGASSATSLTGPTILVKHGSAGAKIDENSVTVSGLGSSPNANAAARVGLGSGDKPALTPSAWDSSAALATHEATVVAGVLKHDQTDYASGYLPVGPDLSSGRSGAQYVTFMFERSALSAFKVNVTGAYAGCWIALPGVSDAQPNGGGWWDGFASYTGSGVPGQTGDTVAGCGLGTPMTGSSGSFQVTFGTASSTSATSNEILVRFKLTAGQSISALSLSN